MKLIFSLPRGGKEKSIYYDSVDLLWEFPWRKPFPNVRNTENRHLRERKFIDVAVC
jgi:hypothetical protein